MATKTLASSTAKTDSLTNLIVLLGVIVVAAAGWLLVRPAYQDRGPLLELVAVATQRADRAEQELASLQNHDTTAAQLLTEAERTDAFFPYVNPDKAVSPSNEINLVYQQIFGAAIDSLGLPPDTITYTFPSQEAVIAVPAGMGAATITVNGTGTTATLTAITDALMAHGIVATIIDVEIAPAEPEIPIVGSGDPAPQVADSDDPMASMPTISASDSAITFKTDMLIWYSTIPAIDLSGAITPDEP